MTQQCGHDEQWLAYRNPVDPNSDQYCLFCECERLRTLHADSPNRNYGDGDAMALWQRIDDFRADPDATLAPDDVRALAEWWSDIHDTLGEMDERNCELAREVERLRQAVKILYAGTIQGHSAHWDNEGTHGANCPACESARLHREAAVKCLGYVPDSFFLDEAAEAARSKT